MTISIKIGKFKAKIEYQIFMAKRNKEVEFDITWSSCGVYCMSYYRPLKAEDHQVIVTKDWYPPNIAITFTPEHLEKTAELYSNAPKNERHECYKPFYEDYDLDRCMIDFGNDILFQAYRDPRKDIEKVYMVNRRFVCGVPDTHTDILGLFMDDFQKLKDLIDNEKEKIFYSGCKIQMKEY